MMLAFGSCVSSPSSDSASEVFWASVSCSGKFARMRPASEMSRVSTAMPIGPAKALMTGRKEYVARAGASSVWV